MTFIKYFTCCLLLFCHLAHAENPRISIIIDDLGYTLDQGRQAIALPGAINVSILPDTPFALTLAEEAHVSGKEILLHLPMQAHNHDHHGEQPLLLDMDKNTFVRHIRHQLASVPYAKGVNNHKGSLLTEQLAPMGWLMTELRQWGDLFYIDSRTTPNSVALQRANENGLRSLPRHVFLDHDKDFFSLETQFNRLLNIARTQGYAIAIGHPHEQTLAFLRARLPQLQAEGIELVYAGELTQQHSESPTWQASLSPSPKAAKN